ncbi:MAG: secretin N-terminal domain-containing protein [bacterium]
MNARSTFRVALVAGLAFVSARSPASAQDTTRAGAATSRFDFQDADLRTVITAIAEAGGLNVTYGDLPSRRVTLHSPQPVPRSEMFAVLRSVAASNGLRLAIEGTLIRVEAADAPATTAQSGRAREASQLFVYRLKHARAPRLASTLQALYGARAGDLSSSSGLSDRQLTEQLRSTRVPMLNIDTIGRGAASSPALAAVLGNVVGEVQIVPDETTNSLLIRAQAADYPTIRQAIDLLDIRPLQVFIEVLIAEVRRTQSFDLGLSASAEKDKDGNLTSGSLTSTAPTDFLVRFTRGGDLKIDVALSALAQRGNVRILSRPLILAENNLEARILVGSQRPFVQVFRSLPTGDAVRDQVVQYRDVGTVLSLLPTINSDGYVNMQVRQEVSSATSELAFGAPVISTREASTHLFVRDGQTVVIGGLADRQVERTKSGIPGLNALPWIGGLFGSTHDSDTQGELYLFLTPHILATDADADVLRRGIEGRIDSAGGKREDNPPVAPPKTNPPKTEP